MSQATLLSEKQNADANSGLVVTLLETKGTGKVNRTVSFSEDLVASLATDKRKQQFTDRECPGLHLHVTARGAKTFWFRRNLRGAKYELYNLGRWPAVSVESARALALHFKARPIRVFPKPGSLLTEAHRDDLLCRLRHQSTSPTTRDCIRLWLMIGYALKQEIVRMKWADIDLQSGTWVLTNDTKLALCQPVLEILRNRRIANPESCPWVFPAESRQSKQGGHFKFPRRPLLKLLLQIGLAEEAAAKIAGTRGIANLL